MTYPELPDALTNYYWPHRWNLDDDGLLTIKATGYDAETTHYTGFRYFAPSSPDYRFWLWLVQEKQPDSIVAKEDLAPLMAEFMALAPARQ